VCKCLLQVYPHFLSFVPKLAARYPPFALGSLKDVTTRQRRLSAEHLHSAKKYPHFLSAPDRQASGTLSPQENSKALSYRRSSYLGIRNFFINSPAHCLESRNISSLSQCAHISTTSRHIFQPSSIPNTTGTLDSSIQVGWPEYDWQENTDGYTHKAYAVGTHFDWRTRASSRIRRRDTLTLKDDETRDPHRRAMQRISPPQIDVGVGEPFFEEIDAYRKRYVVAWSPRIA
jgi:hypothetical protein